MLRTAPFVENMREDATRHHSGQMSVALDILAPEDRGIDAEEQLQVMIADVLEVPSGAAVAGYASLPRGMMGGGYAAARCQALEIAVFGNVREAQALRGELHRRMLGVPEWAAVRTDPVVVTDALRYVERQRAARRGR